ncbi:hypothetical protein ACG7TL_006228 [Trametes sanguinea]
MGRWLLKASGTDQCFAAGDRWREVKRARAGFNTPSRVRGSRSLKACGYQATNESDGSNMLRTDRTSRNKDPIHQSAIAADPERG